MGFDPLLSYFVFLCSQQGHLYIKSTLMTQGEEKNLRSLLRVGALAHIPLGGLLCYTIHNSLVYLVFQQFIYSKFMSGFFISGVMSTLGRAEAGPA